MPYKSVETNLNLIPHYRSITFKGKDTSFDDANKYLETQTQILHDSKAKLYLSDFDMDKLDGLQEGIKVFDKMTMREIKFVATTLLEMPLIRGCHNQCSHCYADAKPPIKEDAGHIRNMSWNDFETLTDGFKELNDRLGFKIENNDGYNTMFHDADCIDIALKDNNGIEHDFIDLSDRMYDSTGVKQLFDTAGWSPKNQVAQARAEKYAQYYSESKNIRKFEQFNISANPFHVMNTRYVQYLKENNLEKAEKFRELYTDRMANVLFTFTPLVKYDKFQFIARAIKNDSKNVDGFTEKDLRKLYKEIFKKLRARYEHDLHGEKKFIKNDKQLKSALEAYKHKLDNVGTKMSVSERLAKILNQNDPLAETTNKEISNTKKLKNGIENKYDLARYCGVLDVNGKYYLTDFYSTIPTEIQLNFENKNKQTADISPYLQDFTISRKTINSL